MTNVREEVERAEERIRPFVRETMLEHSPELGAIAGANVYCKLEALQYTGSFKVRGAFNRMLVLSDEERARGVVAASTGNHGAAVAYAAAKLGTTGIVFVPTGASPSKTTTIERFGGDVRTFGEDPADTERHARDFAQEHGLTYISPYNDPLVVAGQGTIAVELERQLGAVDVVFASLGGGGLISGIAGYLKATNPGVRIVGCSPDNSRVMIESMRAGRIVDTPSFPTLSDGTAGGVEAGAITFDLCRRLIDDTVTVTEPEIEEALRRFVHYHHVPIEGAAAVAVASYWKWCAGGDGLAGRTVVVVICGANIDLGLLKRILSSGRS
jgi:threonine dehydratase